MYQAVHGEHAPLRNAHFSHQQPHSMPRIQTTRRLGLWIRLLICLAMLVLVAAAGFLTWLWHEPNDNVQWRNLMLSPYATQLITITGFLVRAAVSFLAIVATSMIASIALETRGVPLEAVAQFSVARFANNGPLSWAW
ncbi:hypothetical protein GQ53DRAFT_102257 [Thozetella sp. PMI_491]|nr:hypothetical protein GQ53DRAFT_102257 [Thozetella sp. PMI_491]